MTDKEFATVLDWFTYAIFAVVLVAGSICIPIVS